MRNPEHKHIASLTIAYEICEELPTGESSASPVDVNKVRHTIRGFSLADCRKRLAEALERLRKC